MPEHPFQGLYRQIAPHRAHSVAVDGHLAPGSVPILLSMLDAGADRDKRWYLRLCLVSECEIADRTAPAVRYAAAHFQEFGDVTSLIGYARALVNNKEFEEGLKRARDAVTLAIEQQALINFAACQYVRD